jgi:hypothetical protein
MRPLLLVHGIVSNARHTFGTPGIFFKTPKSGGMFEFLFDQGYQPGKTLFWFSYPTLKPLLASARRLQQEIARVREISGSQEIDLVTFSLGGIVGKYYAVSPFYQNEIGKMVMIAPPFLGSPRADFFKTRFRQKDQDLFLPGDSRALSPQFLGFHHPLLLELAARPFPGPMQTAIIAMKIEFGECNDLRSKLERTIATTWIGDGDQTVPLESTQIPVDRHYVVVDDHAPQKVHGFLPNHQEIQKLVLRELQRE